MRLPEHLHPDLALDGLSATFEEGSGDEAGRRQWVKDVVEATDFRCLYCRPSSLLMESYWTPHYAAMWGANSLMSSGDLVMEDFGPGVWLRELEMRKRGWSFISLGGTAESS